MTRGELENFILDSYSVSADYPFEEDFETGVFRHGSNKKWFGIAMRIPYNRIVPDRDGIVDVVNVKCPPEIIASIVAVEPGVYPAYHMNKGHWVTLALDGSCDDGLIGWLVGISFELTQAKIKTK